jgi:hypothetical protein
VWSFSPALTRPGARAGLRLAGAGNLGMVLGFGWLASRGSGRGRFSGLLPKRRSKLKRALRR